ncbi:MTAP family purine nucleoside phosphorylase [Glaciibacter flavus]|uniref:MTAP family purine nucleoside phosphorylase n=1 Tax=Orlajensenia flava TaxID=2565934 RepID=UPI003B009837
MTAENVRIGVIGGSGVYRLFPDGVGERRAIETPFGVTVTVTVGEVGGRRVAFLPRHGADHSVPPHRLDGRPVAWALATLGVRAIISTAAVGSLTPDIPVGSLVLADQLVDRTYGRPQTFFDADLVRHLPFSDPFCPELHAVALGAVDGLVPTASVVVIQGPRFSTRAESRINRAAGIDLVNMTLLPEVALAAELGMGTATLCVVTDVDSGEQAEDAVTAEAVFSRLAAAEPHILEAIGAIARAIPVDYAGRPLIDADAVASVLGWPIVTGATA